VDAEVFRFLPQLKKTEPQSRSDSVKTVREIFSTPSTSRVTIAFALCPWMVRELRQANKILRKASACFAAAELDRPFKK
jgi:hypothetical protein